MKVNMSPGFRGLRQLRAAIFDPVCHCNASFGGTPREIRRKFESAEKPDMQPVYQGFRGKLAYVILSLDF